MDKRKKALRFARYLDDLEHGKDVNAWLAQHADIAEEIIALGQIAQTLKSMHPDENLLKNSESKSHQRFLDAAQPLVASSGMKGHALWQRLPVLQRVAVMGIVVLICLASIGGGIVYASNTSLPGDPLYSVKLAREDTQRFFTQETQKRILLEEHLSSQRFMEVTTVLESNREVAVHFDGVLYDMQPDYWIINNLLVQIPNNTTIDGNPTLGCFVDVRARASSQWQLIATAIKVEGKTYIGLLNAIESDFLTVNGITMAINPAMPMNPAVQVGDTVLIHTRGLPNGEQYTFSVEPDKESSETRRIELRGSLEITNGAHWRVGNSEFLITPQTHIDGSLKSGDQVKAVVVRLLDGSLFAIEIESAPDHNEPPASELLNPEEMDESEPENKEEAPEGVQDNKDDTEHPDSPDEPEEKDTTPHEGDKMDTDDSHDSGSDEEIDHAEDENHDHETKDYEPSESDHEESHNSGTPEAGEVKDKEHRDG